MRWLILASVLLMTGCATHEFSQRFAAYADDGKTTKSLTENKEKALLFIGERHAVVNAKGAGYDIGKADVVALGGEGVAIYGLATGNPIAAIAGLMTTLWDDYFNQAKTRANTASTQAK